MAVEIRPNAGVRCEYARRRERLDERLITGVVPHDAITIRSGEEEPAITGERKRCHAVGQSGADDLSRIGSAGHGDLGLAGNRDRVSGQTAIVAHGQRYRLRQSVHDRDVLGQKRLLVSLQVVPEQIERYAVPRDEGEAGEIAAGQGSAGRARAWVLHLNRSPAGGGGQQHGYW